MGVSAGNVCQSDTGYVTCGLNAQNCVVVSNANGTCPGGSKPCRGNPGSAACTCTTTAPAECFVSGAFRPGSFCTGTAPNVTVTSCAADANGCATGATSDCRPPRGCAGTAPNVTCQCLPQFNPPECMGVGHASGNYCADPATLIMCTDNGLGCQGLGIVTCLPTQGCVGVHPQARCADEIVYGQSKTDGLGFFEAWSERFIAIPVNVSVPSTIRRLGLLWAGNGANAIFADTVMMGLYPDGLVNNTPAPLGRLIAGVPALAVDRPGNFEGKVAAPVAADVPVPAGNYWLLVNIQLTPSTGRGLGSVARLSAPEQAILTAPFPFSKGLPTEIPASTAFTAAAFKGPLNVYVVGLPQQ